VVPFAGDDRVGSRLAWDVLSDAVVEKLKTRCEVATKELRSSSSMLPGKNLRNDVDLGRL
jgi:hypothetical protein